MTKRQRMRNEIRLAISQNAVGAGRDAALERVREKYGPGQLSTAEIDRITRHVCYPEN